MVGQLEDLAVGTGGSERELHPPDTNDDESADLEQLQPDGAAGRRREFRAGKADAAHRAHEHILARGSCSTMNTMPQPASAALSDANRVRIIVGVLICLLLAALDHTIVAPVIPAIMGAALGHSSYISWIASAYVTRAPSRWHGLPVLVGSNTNAPSAEAGGS